MLAPHLLSAQISIHLCAEQLGDAAVLEALLKRALSGVRVYVLCGHPPNFPAQQALPSVLRWIVVPAEAGLTPFWVVDGVMLLSEVAQAQGIDIPVFEPFLAKSYLLAWEHWAQQYGPTVAGESEISKEIAADVGIWAMQLELQWLEAQLATLCAELSSIESLLHRWRQRYNDTVGELVRQILWLEQELAKRFSKKNAATFQAAKERFEQFNEQFEQAQKQTAPKELSEEQRLEMKRLYREAVLRCHPDRFPEHLQSMAQDMFVAFQRAYEQNDWEALQKLHEQIMSGAFTQTTMPNERAVLEAKINALKAEIQSKAEALKLAQFSTNYQKVKDSNRWDELLREAEIQLSAKLEELFYNYKNTI